VSNLDLNQSSQTDLSTSQAEPSMAIQQDVSMLDAPASPSKVARERDDDEEDGRSAKRAKTEGESSSTSLSTTPRAPVTQNGTAAAAPGDDLPPTAHQQKELLKAIKNIKGTVNGKNFVRPVVELWPTIKESYLEKVSHPMDFATIEHRLKDGSYESMGAFKRDVRLIYENALTYNGPSHVVTGAGAYVRDYLMNKIPGPEPVKPEKKKKAVPVADAPPRAPPARRESRGAVAAATSPTTAPPAQTFALDPSGTPVIRRDSTMGEGGRPKREIHPPKSKDLVYNARPKKKKFATELKFCQEVLNEMKKPKYLQISGPFLAPVDPVALSIPDYFKIIKTPMDISTVASRLESGQYENAKDFETDMRLIFKNCYKFNPPGSPVNLMGKQYEEVFDREWARKAQYIADHTSTSNAPSPESETDSDEEESEEDEPEPAGNSTSAIQERLIEEQNKLIGIMGAKKPDPVLIRMQQEMISIIQKQMDAENAKKKKTKSKPKPTKKSSMSKKKSDKVYRPKNIGMQEKEQISAGIQQLTGKLLDQAFTYLQMDYPNLSVSISFVVVGA
jgi:bromodomain-containing factor 1